MTRIRGWLGGLLVVASAAVAGEPALPSGTRYPVGPDGKVRKFDDLPAAYVENVNTKAPFGPKRLLSDADVDDIVAFLQTLTDGYRP